MKDHTGPRGPKPGILTTIQAARGLAALVVVLCHSQTMLGSPAHLGHQVLGGLFRFGHAGVDFFFVLSGFIICMVHARDIGRPATLGRYLSKRFLRIYPIYWVVLALVAGLVLLNFIPELSPLFHTVDRRTFHSFFLLPQHESPILGVSWTLQHEVLFYAVFAILIANRRAGSVVIAAWFALCVYSMFQPRDQWPWSPADLVTGFLGSSYHFQFLAGAGAAWLVARNKMPYPLLFALAGVIGFALTGWAETAGKIEYLGQAGRFLFGASATLIVTGLASAEQRGKASAHGTLVFLGAASYSIYLIHASFIMGLAYPVTALHLPAWVKFFILAAGGLASGIIVHLLFEKPLMSISRRRIAPSRVQSGSELSATNPRIEFEK